MIGYVTLGSNDVAKAAAFYDELLAIIGAKRVFDYERFVAWSNAPGTPMLAVITPFDGSEASVGNGSMVALSAGSEAIARQLHAKALALGGQNEGDPGPRFNDMFFCAYARDLDGNKLNFFAPISA